MSKDVLRAIALSLGGLVVALVLTVGAFAIVGQDISQPAGVPTLTATLTPSSEHEVGEGEHPGKTPSRSVDDHDAGSGSDVTGSTATEGPDGHASSSGSDDEGGSDDSSGSGSGGSNSGPGSSSSGSGSGSGSGSDDSGEHGDD